MISGQPAIRVAVNDRQLPVLAIEDGGRVLVPFRAIVEALGGNVSQFHLPLPPPARVVAGRTYVPIRYLATQLHAQIEYDARTRIVQVFTTAASPAPAIAEQPAPNTRVGSAYPTISANFPVAAGTSIASLRLLVDNVDVTKDARYAGAFVTYIPRDGLTQGTHTVSLSGTGTDGKTFQSSWSFETTTAAEPDVATTTPFYGTSPIQFNVSGNQFVGGAPINVQMTAPPGGEAYAFVCTSAWHFPLYAAPLSQFYSASIPTSAVGAAINCPVTVMYVAPNGSVMYAPYPIFVQLLPPNTPAQPSTPVPQPTRIPVPPTVRRTPPPTPMRTPAPVTKVTPAPHPRIGVPKVRPTPLQ